MILTGRSCQYLPAVAAASCPAGPTTGSANWYNFDVSYVSCGLWKH